jgi:hypothetical protein
MLRSVYFTTQLTLPQLGSILVSGDGLGRYAPVLWNFVISVDLNDLIDIRLIANNHRLASSQKDDFPNSQDSKVQYAYHHLAK